MGGSESKIDIQSKNLAWQKWEMANHRQENKILWGTSGRKCLNQNNFGH